MITIFELSQGELDAFIISECGAPVNKKTRKAAIEAFRGWIEEYYSEGNLSMGAESFFQRIIKDTD